MTATGNEKRKYCLDLVVAGTDLKAFQEERDPLLGGGAGNILETRSPSRLLVHTL